MGPFRNTVRDHRLARGMSIRELAKAADLSFSLICKAEKGERIPSDTAKRRIADALGISVITLFYPDCADIVLKPHTTIAVEAGAA
jgi:transcriptional regulator with XRE-family HTH domain